MISIKCLIHLYDVKLVSQNINLKTYMNLGEFIMNRISVPRLDDLDTTVPNSQNPKRRKNVLIFVKNSSSDSEM